jgi:hypothetical protein
MDKNTKSLLEYVLFEKYKVALNRLLIESFLFRIFLFVSLILVMTIPLKLSPLGIALASLLLSLFWRLRIELYAKEVSAFENRVVDYEGKTQENEELITFYIYWHRDLDERPIRSIQNFFVTYEPWIWLLIVVLTAVGRNFVSLKF